MFLKIIMALMGCVFFHPCPFAQEITEGEKETPFTLFGNIRGRDSGVIVLRYSKDGLSTIQDTSIIEGGKFFFRGTIPEPTFCWLKIPAGKGNSTSFFLEGGRQEIFLQESKFADFTMSGSFTQRQADTLKNSTELITLKYKDVNDAHSKLVTEYGTSKDSTGKVKVYSEILKLQPLIKNENKERNEAMIAFISGHHDSFVSSNYLYSILTNHMVSNDSATLLYNKFTNRIKSSLSGKMIQKELNSRKTNIEAPDFTVITMGNKLLSLRNFRGKYVLVNFWASYCIPCIKEFPDFKKALDSYQTLGFEIINISVDRNKPAWLDAVNKLKLQRFVNILAQENDSLKVKYPNITQPIPSQILIDRKGYIIWNSVNENAGDEIMDILATEMKKK